MSKAISKQKYQIIDRRTGDVVNTVEALEPKYVFSVAGIAREQRRHFIIEIASSNVLLLDSKAPGFRQEYIDPDKIPAEATTVRYHNKSLFLVLVNRDDPKHNGEYEAFKRPEEIKATPQKLRRVFEVKKLIDKALRPRSDKWEKIRAGLMILLIILFIVGLLLLKGSK